MSSAPPVETAAVPDVLNARERAFAQALFAWERELYGEDEFAETATDAEGPVASDADVVAALLSRPADLLDAVTLAQVDVASLPDKLTQLQVARRLDEVAAMVAARQMAVAVALAGPVASPAFLDEVHAETEIALARGLSPTLVGLEIETARALASTFPGFGEALARGEVSVGHCRRLVEATRCTTNEQALAIIGEKALPRAKGRTVPLFARALRALIARYDPDAASRRKERIATTRDVTLDRLEDGMGRLIYTDEWVKVNAVATRIRLTGRATQVARRRAATTHEGPAAFTGTAASAKARRKAGRTLATRAARAELDHDEATAAGQCRADAMLALMLGVEHANGTVTLDPDTLVRVETQVVIDLATLRGEADHVALLDGEPVPASIGRAWARRAHTYRRMVTDPVTGHLLDRGRTYRADDVRDFVLARDGRCRLPICGIQHPDRLQADHATEHPAGATSAANLGALSTTHHQLKTNGYLRITDSAADGSATLRTLWGQRILIPPRAYLNEPDTTGWTPTPPAPAAPADADDDPPF